MDLPVDLYLPNLKGVVPVSYTHLAANQSFMKKKLPITKNKDVVVSWVYTWSKQPNRVYDSCADKDCLADMRVYFTDRAQCIIDNATSVRCRSCKIINLSLIHI